MSPEAETLRERERELITLARWTSHVGNAKLAVWSLLGRKEENCRKLPATVTLPQDRSLNPFIMYLPLGKRYFWSQVAGSTLIPGKLLFPASLPWGRVRWVILANELCVEAPWVPSGQRQGKPRSFGSILPCHCALESMCWYTGTLGKSKQDSSIAAWDRAALQSIRVCNVLCMIKK